MFKPEVWKKLIDKERPNLEKRLSDLEISALEDWYEDCYEGFEKIYNSYSKGIANSNCDVVHDSIVDIYHELQHIKMHIQDAENSFIELMNLIESKIDKNE